MEARPSTGFFSLPTRGIRSILVLSAPECIVGTRLELAVHRSAGVGQTIRGLGCIGPRGYQPTRTQYSRAKEAVALAGNERITSVQLGDYLDGRLDEGLEILTKRNPGFHFEREQLVRLAVGYGLNSLFRQEARRSTELSGFYQRILDQDPEERMVMEDLSLRGARFRVFLPNPIQVNEILRIRFTLDDAAGTEVAKSVVTKNIVGSAVGVAFFDPQADPILEAYLAARSA